MSPLRSGRPSSRPHRRAEREGMGRTITSSDTTTSTQQQYTAITRLIIAGGLCCLTALTALLVVVSNLSGTQAALTAGVLISGLATLIGLAGALSLWTIRRRDESRQGEREENLLRAIAAKSRLVEVRRSDLAAALEALSSADTAMQISALSELSAFSRTSAENALVIVPAIESFIRARVPGARSTELSSDEVGVGKGKPEVQVGLEILGTLPEHIRFNARRPIRFHLEELDLREYNLQNLDFSAASLRRSNLTGCILSFARFDGSDLRGTIFARCIVNGVTFQRAILEGAVLRSAFAPDADLSGALLYRVDMRGATLFRADFSASVLFDCDLRDADLREADLDSVKARANRVVESQLATYGLLRLVDPLGSPDLDPPDQRVGSDQVGPNGPGAA